MPGEFIGRLAMQVWTRIRDVLTDSSTYSTRDVGQLFVLIVATYLVAGSPVYRYAMSNQTNQFPLVKHVLDPNYLANDWTVGVRTQLGSPRYYYVRLLAGFTDFIGLSTAILLLYLISTLILVIALWVFVSELFENELVAVIVVGIFLAHNTTLPGLINYFPPDLGGNELVQNYLIPSHLANALLLVGMVLAVRRRYRWAYSLFGVATVVHLVNGFWIAVTIGICILAVEAWPSVREGRIRVAIQKIPWDAAMIYGVVSLPATLPLAIANFGARAGFEAVYVDAWVRHPHHKVPTTWPLADTIATVLFIFITVALLFGLFREIIPSSQKRRFIAAYVGTLSTAMFFGGYVFTEIVPIGTIVQLQAFRVDDFLFIPLYGAVAKVFVVRLHRVSQWTSMDGGKFATRTLTVFLLIMLVVSTVSGGSFIYVSSPSQEGTLQESYTWIKNSTPENAVFLAPSSIIRFRMETSRARVVNLKSFPFQRDASLEWERRMNDVCDTEIRSLEQGGGHLIEPCDRGFEQLSEQEVRKIGEKYNAGWILTPNGSYSFERKFSTDGWHVYKIENTTSVDGT